MFDIKKDLVLGGILHIYYIMPDEFTSIMDSKTFKNKIAHKVTGVHS